MTLAELAFGCYIYAAMTGYDSGYSEFLRKTSPALDLTQEQHRKSLLEWLNKWGCRQFKIAHHDSAANEIKAWYAEVNTKLFPEHTHLLSLTDTDLGAVEEVYNGLVNRIASIRTMGNGKETEVRFGPVGTAKILFALRPDALMPWDKFILEDLDLDGSAGSYRQYLRKATKWLNELNDDCKKKGFELANLPSLVGRPKSPLPKLVDEYLWVTVSQKCKAPSKSVFERWVEWS